MCRVSTGKEYPGLLCHVKGNWNKGRGPRSATRGPPKEARFQALPGLVLEGLLDDGLEEESVTEPRRTIEVVRLVDHAIAVHVGLLN